MLDPIHYAVSAVMWAWHQLFALLLGPTSGAAWALSVVFLVLTLRALIIGPVLASLRSTRTMRALGPQLAELRRRHADDRVALVRETRALQVAHGVGPPGGCLPALVQLPVFVGLLHVLQGFDRPGLTFEQDAALAHYAFPPAAVRSFLEARLFGVPLSASVAMPQDPLDGFGGPVEWWQVVAVALPLVVLAAVATPPGRPPLPGARRRRRSGRDGPALDPVGPPRRRRRRRVVPPVPGGDPAVLAHHQHLDAGPAVAAAPLQRRGPPGGGAARAAGPTRAAGSACPAPGRSPCRVDPAASPLLRAPAPPPAAPVGRRPRPGEPVAPSAPARHVPEPLTDGPAVPSAGRAAGAQPVGGGAQAPRASRCVTAARAYALQLGVPGHAGVYRVHRRR